MQRAELWPLDLVPSPMLAGQQRTPSASVTTSFLYSTSPLSVECASAAQVPTCFDKRNKLPLLDSDEACSAASGKCDLPPALDACQAPDQSPSSLRKPRRPLGAGAAAYGISSGENVTARRGPFTTPAALKQQIQAEAEAILSEFRLSLSAGFGSVTVRTDDGAQQCGSPDATLHEHTQHQERVLVACNTSHAAAPPVDVTPSSRGVRHTPLLGVSDVGHFAGTTPQSDAASCAAGGSSGFGERGEEVAWHDSILAEASVEKGRHCSALQGPAASTTGAAGSFKNQSSIDSHCRDAKPQQHGALWLPQPLIEEGKERQNRVLQDQQPMALLDSATSPPLPPRQLGGGWRAACAAGAVAASSPALVRRMDLSRLLESPSPGRSMPLQQTPASSRFGVSSLLAKTEEPYPDGTGFGFGFAPTCSGDVPTPMGVSWELSFTPHSAATSIAIAAAPAASCPEAFPSSCTGDFNGGYLRTSFPLATVPARLTASTTSSEAGLPTASRCWDDCIPSSSLQQLRQQHVPSYSVAASAAGLTDQGCCSALAFGASPHAPLSPEQQPASTPHTLLEGEAGQVLLLTPHALIGHEMSWASWASEAEIISRQFLAPGAAQPPASSGRGGSSPAGRFSTSSSQSRGSLIPPSPDSSPPEVDNQQAAMTLGAALAGAAPAHSGNSGQQLPWPTLPSSSSQQHLHSYDGPCEAAAALPSSTASSIGSSVASSPQRHHGLHGSVSHVAAMGRSPAASSACCMTGGGGSAVAFAARGWQVTQNPIFEDDDDDEVCSGRSAGGSQLLTPLLAGRARDSIVAGAVAGAVGETQDGIGHFGHMLASDRFSPSLRELRLCLGLATNDADASPVEPGGSQGDWAAAVQHEGAGHRGATAQPVRLRTRRSTTEAFGGTSAAHLSTPQNSATSGPPAIAGVDTAFRALLEDLESAQMLLTAGPSLSPSESVMGPPTVHDGGYGARRSQPAATAFMGFLTPTVPAAADANEACAASVSSSVPKQQLAASAAVGQAIPKLLKLVRENNGLQRANDQLRSELSRAQAAQLEVQARNKLLQALLDERGHEVARLSNTHLRRTFKLESQLTSCRELIRQLERMQSQLTLEGLQQLQQLEEANRHAALLSAEVASLRERVMEYNDASCPMQHQEQELEQELATFAAEAVQEIEAAAAAVAAEVQEQRLQLRPPFCESTVDPELVELATSFGVPRGFSTRLLQPAAQCSSPFPHMISAWYGNNGHHGQNFQPIQLAQHHHQHHLHPRDQECLQRQVFDLQQQLVQAQEHVEQLQNEMEAARVAMGELVAERAAARAEVARSKDVATGLAAEVVATVQAAEVKAMEDKQRMQKTMRECKGQLGAVLSQLKAHQMHIIAQDLDMQQLVTQLHDERAALQQVADLRKQQQVQLESDWQAIMQQEVESLQQQRAQWQVQVEQLTQECAQLQQKWDDMQQEAEQHKQAAVQLQQQLDEERHHSGALEVEVQTATHRLLDFKRQLQAVSSVTNAVVVREHMAATATTAINSPRPAREIMAAFGNPHAELCGVHGWQPLHLLHVAEPMLQLRYMLKTLEQTAVELVEVINGGIAICSSSAHDGCVGPQARPSATSSIPASTEEQVWVMENLSQLTTAVQRVEGRLAACLPILRTSGLRLQLTKLQQLEQERAQQCEEQLETQVHLASLQRVSQQLAAKVAEYEGTVAKQQLQIAKSPSIS